MDPEILAESDLLIEAPRTEARRGYDRVEVDTFVDATRARLQTMAARLGHQQSEMQQLRSENRAFSRTINIAITAAEEVMTEATATAGATVAEAEARAAEVVASAERRAAEIIAVSSAEAHERVTVAKADARDAMSAERTRIEAELAMVAALQERIEDERAAFDTTRDDLVATLREAGTIMIEVADDPVGTGRRLLSARAEQAQADHEAEQAFVDESSEVDDDTGEPSVTTPLAPSMEELAELDAGEAERLDSRSEFFSTEIEDDPSRKWILS